MSEISSCEYDKCNSIYSLEKYKQNDVINLEKLLKILESFGFFEIAIK
jgi:hypothetical protein